MWLYIGAFIVLLGGCLNAEMDALRARARGPDDIPAPDIPTPDAPA